MHRVQAIEVGIGSSDGSTHRQSTIPMRLFDSPDRQSPLDAMTSPDVGYQQGPSPTTTPHDVREESSIECEVVILEQYVWLASDHFPLLS